MGIKHLQLLTFHQKKKKKKPLMEMAMFQLVKNVTKYLQYNTHYANSTNRTKSEECKNSKLFLMTINIVVSFFKEVLRKLTQTFFKLTQLFSFNFI